MPIMKCTLPNGKSGYKFGKSGKCYPTKEEALRQMRAIKHQQSKSKEEEFIEEVIKNLENR
jgi:hypothetical protein